jgi:hypothetical protein
VGKATKASPAEAVRAYHASLAEAGVMPIRAPEDDLDLADPVMRSE